MAQPTAYQRVSSQYDITEAGVTSLDYLAFDGSDDVLKADGAFVNGSDATFVAGFSDVNTGIYFGAFLPTDPEKFCSAAKTSTQARAFIRNAPGGVVSDDLSESDNSAVIFAIHDDASNTIQVRSNGVDGAGASTGSITLSGFNTLTIGATGDSTPGPGDGNFYGGIAINRLFTTQEISDTESYVANLSGVTI